MRVVLLVTDLELGGTPLRLARWARGLRAAGVEAIVGCLAPPGPVSRVLDGEGIATFACGARRAWHVGALLRLRRTLKSLRPDVVHSTLVHANVAARLVCPRLRIPLVTSTATIEVERRWHVTLERLTGGWDRGQIVVGEALAEHVRRAFRRPAEKVIALPHVLPEVGAAISRDEARRALGIAASDRVVAWAGRFDPVKRVELLVEAAALLPGDGWRVLLAGDGPLRGRVERQATRSGVGDRVRLLGWQSDLGPLLTAADVLAFPSLTEGVPNVVLAAMRAGAAVVASDIAAHRELLGEGRGVLIGDAAASTWARAIEEVAGDAERRARIQVQVAAWSAGRPSFSEFIARLVAAYRSLCGF